MTAFSSISLSSPAANMPTSATESHSMRVGTAARWLAIFGIWTFLGLLSAAQSVIYLRHIGQPVPWGEVLASRLSDWYTCALFTPAYIWLVRNYPLDRRSWPRTVTVLIGATSVFVVIKYVLYAQLGVWTQGWFANGSAIRTLESRFTSSIASSFITESIAFWAVIAVLYGWEFYSRMRERELQTVRLRAELSEARLAALAAQLRPHFLFNALHGVSTLMHRDVEAADAMLANLAGLLRRTLQPSRDGDRHEVTLREEAETLNLYINLVAERFKDRLTVRVAIPDELSRAVVPHFVLQPLVENAFEHGIARKAGPGKVEVAAERIDGMLRLTVSDDGPGLAGNTQSVREGVGLSNTRRRLRELYGDRQDLSVESTPGVRGLRVAVSIPFRQGGA